MELSNLKARPDKFKDTLALIEKSFGYQAPNRFDVDFYPLMKNENWENCHILLLDGEVVAHTGFVVKNFEIKKEVFPVLFIGGVAVDEKHRGLGLSTRLLKNIFDTFPQAALYILWSDKVDLYRKQAFFPCVELYETAMQKANSTNFKREQFHSLAPKDLELVKHLYKNKKESRPKRNEDDWEDINKITSVEFWAKREGGTITNYFFKNKGQDLTGVIHEYGSLKDHKEMLAHGKLWSSSPFENSVPLFGALVKMGRFAPCSSFIQASTGNLIAPNSLGESAHFVFEGKNLKLPAKEFLQGLFGPGRFEELKDVKKIFIPGIDSV